MVLRVARNPQLRLQFGRIWLRDYSATTKRPANRIFNPLRTEEELESLILLSASSRIPFITLWTASWCPSCKVVSPIIKHLVESNIGQEHGGLSFAEVEMDAPTMAGMAMRYQISSIPTLLAFDRSEAQLGTKVTSVDDLKNKQFLTSWLETEAKRHGEGGAGSGGGGLFGLFRR